MSKALKKLIDINRLREFKNKLVGAGSAYVQTAAVDQTIAGTKTFSKPIVGSVTGSSGSCTGNAATATKATQDSAGQQINTTYIKGLAVSGRTITYTKGDGTTGTITTQDTNTWTAFKGATSSANGTAGYVPAPTKGNQGKFFKADGTWATPPNTTYASMSASEATTGTATAARTISAKVLHDKINSNLSAYATKTELNKGLTTKANDSAVVHKSGDETIAGTKTFSNGVLLTAVNAFMAQAGGYTLLLRNDGRDTYLLMSDKGGAPGTWSDARPFVINNSTGVCDINGNASTATRAANADHATNADRAASAKRADYATSADSATKAIILKSNSSADHEIRLDWSRQVPGFVGLRVDATDLGGIATTSGTYDGMTVGRATRATQDSDGNKITTTYSKNGHTHDDRYYTENEVNNLLNGKANTSHTHPYIPTSASCNKNWNWSGKGGQPTWLWGGEDGINMYVYNPSNFSVNYANSAGYAATAANGVDSQDSHWIRFKNGVQICWGYASSGFAFPKPFTAAPAISLIHQTFASRKILINVGAMDSRNCYYNAYDVTGGIYIDGASVSYIAFGYWSK